MTVDECGIWLMAATVIGGLFGAFATWGIIKVFELSK